MRVLYVTGMSVPIKCILTGKSEDEITGLPAFFHPWYKLVKKGHQVDFVILSNFNQEPDIKVDWFSRDNIYVNIYDPFTEVSGYRRVFRRIKRFLKLLYYTNKALKENKYDFVYCTAYYEGLAGNLVANFRGVPCGMRAYGTILYDDLKKYGAIGAAIRRPLEYLTFKIKKEFLLMSDDGTKGDIVYENWKPKTKKYNFYFWKTGIDLQGVDNTIFNSIIPKHDYLFFAARFDSWKRHDRILKILHKLHCKKLHLHLYFAGNVTSEIYHEELRALAKRYGIEDYVHFLGAIKQDELKAFSYNAVANPLMYDHSNLGNVFFETFSAGSVVVGLNDGSLDDYIVNEVNGFIVNDEDEACFVIEDIMKNKGKVETIRKNAISCAKKKVLSIDARFDMEVDLIENIIASKQVG